MRSGRSPKNEALKRKRVFVIEYFAKQTTATKESAKAEKKCKKTKEKAKKKRIRAHNQFS